MISRKGDFKVHLVSQLTHPPDWAVRWSEGAGGGGDMTIRN